jgi:3',5'-cyclic AMP phosphodiesterase CpdA
VTVGPERHHFDDVQVMERLATAIEGCGQVAGVICGHVHRSTSGLVGAVPAVVMTSVATELRYGDYPGDMAERPIYFVHHFDSRLGFSTETQVAGNGR